MTKIRNKITGEIKEVGENELSNYGLSSPVPQPEQKSFLGKLTNVLVPRTKKYVTETLPEYYKEKPTGYLEELKKTVGIAPKAVEAGGELGAWALPTTKAGAGASFLQKVGAGAKTGVGVGTLLGLTKEGTAEERLKAGAGGALTGGIAGGVMTGGMEAVKGVTKKVLSGGAGIIRRLFKPNTTEIAEFTRNTGMKFEDEILKRDASNLQGKSDTEIVNYFRGKFTQTRQAVDNLLEGKSLPKFVRSLGEEKTVDKKEYIFKINNLISKIEPEKGNVLQEGATNSLNTIADDLNKAPEKLTASVLNNIKRQLQNASDSSYSLNGKPTATSRAIAGVATIFKEAVEQLEPRVKDLNKDIQLYRLASRSIERRLNLMTGQKTGDVFGKLLGQLPFLAAGFGYAKGGLPGLLGYGGAVAAGSATKAAYEKPATQIKIANTLQKMLGTATKTSEKQALRAAIDVLKRMGLVGMGRLGAGD